MTCFLFSHACDLHARSHHAHLGKTQGQKCALYALSARKALEITNKCHIANSFVQLESNIRVVNMKKLKCKHCPIPGCGSKFLVCFFRFFNMVDSK